MPKEKRKLIINEEGQVVGFKTVRGRGRPRRKSFLPAWLGGGDRSNNLPDEIIVNDEAPLEVMIIAAFKNVLNGWPLTPLVEDVLRQRGVDAAKVAADRHFYAGELHNVVDFYTEILAQRYDDIGNYVPQFTTASQGTVMSSMTGARDKRGKLRE